MWGITDMPNANFSSIYNPESDVLDESCGEVSTGRVVKSLMTFLILYNFEGKLVGKRNVIFSL